ncbi:uncharacterized protein LAESUDRAFT_747587, partial [Laetiporus sulphureus 93-53]
MILRDLAWLSMAAASDKSDLARSCSLTACFRYWRTRSTRRAHAIWTSCCICIVLPLSRISQSILGVGFTRCCLHLGSSPRNLGITIDSAYNSGSVEGVQQHNAGLASLFR